MPNAKNSIRTATPSILLVGDGGTEKTRFAASCPKPLILDFDAGTASISGQDVYYKTFKDAPWKPPVGAGKKQPGVDIPNGIYPWGEAWLAFIKYLDDVLWPAIEKGPPYIIKTDEGEDYEFETLVPDSLTTMANASMNWVLKTSGKDGRAQPEIQHWGQQLRTLETVMEAVAAWPVRLVVTAHIKRDENLTMGTKEFLPLVAGQLSGKVGIYFDEVYYTKVEGKGVDRKVKIITQTDPLYRMAKSRMNVPQDTLLKWPEIEKALAKVKS